MTKATFRHRVGKTTLSGYLVCKVDEEGFFPDPGEGELRVRLNFAENQQVEARLFRAGGKVRQLKLAYTGEDGAAFRSWLRRSFPARKGHKARGILVLQGERDRVFSVMAESVSQASVDFLWPGGRRYVQGARPISILHPAMLDLETCLKVVELPRSFTVDELDLQIQAALHDCGWLRTESVGSGLALPAGLRRSQAQLHTVFHAAELVSALTSLAAAFELKNCDLGILLVADDRLSGRLLREPGQGTSSMARVQREMELLAFLVRGPICLLSLGSKSALR
ncbi:MAG: hypothetical protein JRF33_24005 [Deltaproteobacteria bacterium]|nr:hypothetical protein [Deltaproteobacteria bacterium]